MFERYPDGCPCGNTPKWINEEKSQLTERSQPLCYLEEEDNPYPLCVGRGATSCAHCCLWCDYDPEEDEARVNAPLPLFDLEKMLGEPVWLFNAKEWVFVASVSREPYDQVWYFTSKGFAKTVLHEHEKFYRYKVVECKRVSR